MPTRFPTGISFIKPDQVTGSYTFTAGDTTPDVSLGTIFYAGNSTVTITGFDNLEVGKLFFVYNNLTNGAIAINTGGRIVLVPYLSGTGMTANTATGVISGAMTTIAKNLSMQSNQIVEFIGVDSSQCVQLDFRNAN